VARFTVVASPLTELTLADLRRRRSLKWREYPEDVLPLWLAEMDTPLAPPIRQALAEAVEIGDTGYAAPGDLRAAFSDFARSRFGWAADPSSTTVIPDVMTGIGALLDLVTAPGDGVVITTPVYPPFFARLNMAGRRIVEAPLAWSYSTGYWLDLDRVATAFAEPSVTACLLSNPHNPTGLVFSRTELLAIASLAERYDVRLLVDEIHAPLVYPGAVHTPILSLAASSEAAARSCALFSATKAWNLPGLKAALLVAGPSASVEIPHEVLFGTGLFGVLASTAAFSAGVPWLDSLLAGLDSNRFLLSSLLASSLPSVGYRPPSATYLAWLDCRSLGLGDDPAAVLLERGRLALSPGPAFGTSGNGFVRLNFATSPAILEEAVARFASVLTSSSSLRIDEAAEEVAEEALEEVRDGSTGDDQYEQDDQNDDDHFGGA
jgi:cystathionine beta-lyase